MRNFIICTHTQISLGKSSQVKSRGMRWEGLVSGMGEERKVYRVLVGKPEGKRKLRTKAYVLNGIRINLKKTGLGGVD
jgi:hypothetical protein